MHNQNEGSRRLPLKKPAAAGRQPGSPHRTQRPLRPDLDIFTAIMQDAWPDTMAFRLHAPSLSDFAGATSIRQQKLVSIKTSEIPIATRLDQIAASAAG